jgi:hypothetical protein
MLEYSRQYCRKMDLKKDVAQNEYLTRSLAYYLRREPYEPAVETYVKELAKKHGVSLAAVRKVRAEYVKKHPLVKTKPRTRATRRRQRRIVALGE